MTLRGVSNTNRKDSTSLFRAGADYAIGALFIYDFCYFHVMPVVKLISEPDPDGTNLQKTICILSAFLEILFLLLRLFSTLYKSRMLCRTVDKAVHHG